MSVLKKHKTTSLFIAFFLIAGISNILTRSDSVFISSLAFCANAAILTGLIVFWIYTVSDRLLPTRLRSNLIVSGLFMILYLLIRVFRYRVIVNANIPGRYSSYIYFIPLLMIPSLFVMTAIDIALADKRAGKRITNAVLISAVILSGLALTNDLHFLVYRPKVELSEFGMAGGSYYQGPGFFLIWGWIIINLLAVFIILFKVMRKKDKKIVIQLVTVVAVWVVVSVFFSYVIERFNLVRMYNPPEINIFFLMLIAECCIRNRLIPYNENYAGFVSKMKIPLLITDQERRVVHTSASPVNASRQTLLSAGTEPLYLDKDTRLSHMKIRAGYIYWTENERELHEEQRRLALANEILSEENDLIEVENKLKEQKARLDVQNQVYEKVSTAIRPKQKRIKELMELTDPESEEFAHKLGIICVYNAYSKRKTNLLLLSEKTLPKRNRELFLALSETARFLKCCGIDAAATGEEYSEIPLAGIQELYDTFETIIETYLSVLKKMTVSILPEGIRIAMEAAKKIELPDSVLTVICKESDGLLFFTIRTGLNGGDSK